MQKDNGIFISSFYGDENDDELKKLMEILEGFLKRNGKGRAS